MQYNSRPQLIVERHGGAIWIDEAAAGTRVVFTLPAVPPGRDGSEP